MILTIFLLLHAKPSWLELSRSKRAEITEHSLSVSLMAKDLTARHFDAEAFHAHTSDIAMIEVTDPKAYYFAIEALRDTPLVAEGYFEIRDVIPAYENGFQTYEASHVA